MKLLLVAGARPNFMKIAPIVRALVLTDSGGLQEETTALGIPCFTLRENTERPITVEEGTNVLVGTTKEKILAAYADFRAGRTAKGRIPEFWDGRAAERIVSVLRVNRDGIMSVQH